MVSRVECWWPFRKMPPEVVAQFVAARLEDDAVGRLVYEMRRYNVLQLYPRGVRITALSESDVVPGMVVLDRQYDRITRITTHEFMKWIDVIESIHDEEVESAPRASYE